MSRTRARSGRPVASVSPGRAINHRVATPVAKPRVAGDDTGSGLARDIATHEKLVGREGKASADVIGGLPLLAVERLEYHAVVTMHGGNGFGGGHVCRLRRQHQFDFIARLEVYGRRRHV